MYESHPTEAACTAGHKESLGLISLVFLGWKGSRDSSVGIATRYGLDGPGIESLWGRDIPHPSRLAMRPTQPPIQWVPVLSRG